MNLKGKKPLNSSVSFFRVSGLSSLKGNYYTSLLSTESPKQRVDDSLLANPLASPGRGGEKTARLEGAMGSRRLSGDKSELASLRLLKVLWGTRWDRWWDPRDSHLGNIQRPGPAARLRISV